MRRHVAVRLPEDVIARAKLEAEKKHTTFTSLIEEKLRGDDRIDELLRAVKRIEKKLTE